MTSRTWLISRIFVFSGAPGREDRQPRRPWIFCERDEHASAGLHRIAQRFRYCVGERRAQRDGQRYIAEMLRSYSRRSLAAAEVLTTADLESYGANFYKLIRRMPAKMVAMPAHCHLATCSRRNMAARPTVTAP